MSKINFPSSTFKRDFELAEQMILAAVTPLILCILLLDIIVFLLVRIGAHLLRFYLITCV